MRVDFPSSTEPQVRSRRSVGAPIVDAGFRIAESGMTHTGGRGAPSAAVIEAPALPCSEAAGAALASDSALRTLPATGGDDYELAFTAPAASEAAVRAAALSAGIAVTRVGRMVAGEAGEVSLLDDSGKAIRLPSAGWSHF